MVLKTRSASVLLEEINKEEMSFVITAGRSTKSLKTSIEKTGLAAPPYLVFSEADGCYRIVCGFLRIKAVTELGWAEVPAMIFDSKTEEAELFLFSFFENLPHRTFNPVEKANIAERLLGYFSEQIIMETYLPLMGLSPSVRAMDDLLCIMKLENEIKEAVMNGTIAEKNAVRLSRMEKDDRISFFRMFCMVNMSSSKQAEIIENCRDIAIRDNISLRDIAEDRQVERILGQDCLSLSQKGDSIRQWIRKKRFPRLSSSEEKFSKLRKKLELPRNVEISPPPFFEGSTCSIKIDFKTAEDLVRAVEKVKRAAVSKELKEFLEGDH